MILLEISALYKSFTYLLTYLQACTYCSRVALFDEDTNTWLKVQEGWLSPTERTSVSAISLGQNLATPLESRRYVVAFTRLRVESFGYVKRV